MRTEIKELWCDLSDDEVENRRRRMPDELEAHRLLVTEVKGICSEARSRQKESERKVYELGDSIRARREKRA